MNLFTRLIGCLAITGAGAGMIATGPNDFSRCIGLAVMGLGLFLIGRKDTF